MLWEAIAYPYLLTAIFILLLTIADVGRLLFHFKTGFQSLKYICGFPGFSSSPVTDTFCPLDFASISFSSSLAYESEYCPSTNKIIVINGLLHLFLSDPHIDKIDAKNLKRNIKFTKEAFRR